jgi:hypothetical protein
MLLAFWAIRRKTCVLRPGSGIRMVMLLTNSTGLVRATRSISWKSEWARV